MSSIKYDEICSKFYLKVEAYDFVYEDISDGMREEMISEWIGSTLSYPYIRKLFKTISVDEANKTITYELAYKIDDYTDKQFLLDVLAYGMVHAWVEPKVRSITNIAQAFTSSDSKFYSQASHLSELKGLLEDSEKRIRSLIRDRGYFNNNYLDGKKL